MMAWKNEGREGGWICERKRNYGKDDRKKEGMEEKLLKRRNEGKKRWVRKWNKGNAGGMEKRNKKKIS